jgi:uncharacterized Fe-S cluster protein YjdI/CDGSH-type Zn-finger protein
MAEEQRKHKGVALDYTNQAISVHWEPSICIHTGNCLRGLPGVFDAEARPWVRPDAASADEIAAVIETRPTGALSYSRYDGGAEETGPQVAEVEPRLNGPLFLRGNLEVVDATGAVVRRATRIALCRCGQSASNPYCDLSHRRVDFRS